MGGWAGRGGGAVCCQSVRLHSENECVLPRVLTVVIDSSVMFLLQIIVGIINTCVKKEIKSQFGLKFVEPQTYTSGLARTVVNGGSMT